jgi:hypothetical protein
MTLLVNKYIQFLRECELKLQKLHLDNPHIRNLFALKYCFIKFYKIARLVEFDYLEGSINIEKKKITKREV